jgi:threonine dehydrogenase-like Zn-dependent dehydrogenase
MIPVYGRKSQKRVNAMRAAIRRDGRLVVDEMSVPAPGPGQVLCKTLACGICGSDLHALDHYDHIIDLTEQMGGTSGFKRGRDTVFGHEFCCEIIEYGAGADRRFKPGARVVSMPALMTAAGTETVGLSSLTPGGFAQNLLLTEALLHEVPNGLSSEHAALTEPLAVGEHAVARSGAERDHAIMVVGCGPVGLAVIAALKARGLGPVIARDFSPERRAAAERMGADRVVDPAINSPHASWTDMGVPNGPAVGLSPVGEGFRRPLIFECVGVPGLLQSIALAAPGGSRIVVAGVCMETDRIEPLVMITKEIELRYVVAYTANEFAASLGNLAEGATAYHQVITGIVGLDETPDAFARLQTDKSQIKILVKPNG